MLLLHSLLSFLHYLCINILCCNTQHVYYLMLDADRAWIGSVETSFWIRYGASRVIIATARAERTGHCTQTFHFFRVKSFIRTVLQYISHSISCIGKRPLSVHLKRFNIYLDSKVSFVWRDFFAVPTDSCPRAWSQ